MSAEIFPINADGLSTDKQTPVDTPQFFPAEHADTHKKVLSITQLSEKKENKETQFEKFKKSEEKRISKLEKNSTALEKAIRNRIAEIRKTDAQNTLRLEELAEYERMMNSGDLKQKQFVFDTFIDSERAKIPERFEELKKSSSKGAEVIMSTDSLAKILSSEFLGRINAIPELQLSSDDKRHIQGNIKTTIQLLEQKGLSPSEIYASIRTGLLADLQFAKNEQKATKENSADIANFLQGQKKDFINKKVDQVRTELDNAFLGSIQNRNGASVLSLTSKESESVRLERKLAEIKKESEALPSSLDWARNKIAQATVFSLLSFSKGSEATDNFLTKATIGTIQNIPTVLSVFSSSTAQAEPIQKDMRVIAGMNHFQIPENWAIMTLQEQEQWRETQRKSFSSGIELTPNKGENFYFSLTHQEGPNQSASGLTLGMKSESDTLGQTAAGFHFSQSEGKNGKDKQATMSFVATQQITPEFAAGPTFAVVGYDNFSGMTGTNILQSSFAQDSQPAGENPITKLSQSLPFTVEKGSSVATGANIQTPWWKMNIAHHNTSGVANDPQHPYLHIDPKQSFTGEFTTTGFNTPLGGLVPSASFVNVQDGTKMFTGNIEHETGNIGFTAKDVLNINVNSGGNYTEVKRDFKSSQNIYAEQQMPNLFGFADTAITTGYFQNNYGAFPFEAFATFLRDNGDKIKTGIDDGKIGFAYQMQQDRDSGLYVSGSLEHDISGRDAGNQALLRLNIPLHYQAQNFSYTEPTLGIGERAQAVTKQAKTETARIAQAGQRMENIKTQLTPQQQQLVDQFQSAVKAGDKSLSQKIGNQLLSQINNQMVQLQQQGYDVSHLQGIHNGLVQSMNEMWTAANQPVVLAASGAANAAVVAGGVAAAVGVAAVVAGAGGGSSGGSSSTAANAAPTGTDANDTIDEIGAGNSVTYSFAQFLTKLGYTDPENDAATSATFPTIPANITVTANGATMNSGDTWNGTGNLVITGVGTAGGVGTKNIVAKINNAKGSTGNITYSVDVSNVSLVYTNLANQGSVSAGATKYMTATLANLSSEFADAAAALAALSATKVTDNSAVTLGAVEIVDFAAGTVRVSYTGTAPAGTRTDQVVFSITADGETSQSASQNLTKSAF